MSDLKDACGDGALEPRLWHVEIEQVHANGSVSQGKNNDQASSMMPIGQAAVCRRGVVLPMRISIAVHVPPPSAANATTPNEASYLLQRGQSAGAIMQQLVAKLRN